MATYVLLLVLQHQEHSTTFTFGTSDSYHLPSDLASAEGDVMLAHARVTGDVFHRLNPTNFLRIAGGAETFRYDWSRETGLPEDFAAFRLDGTYIHGYDAHWSGVLHASTAFHYEEGADVADGSAYSLAVGALYRSGSKLTVGGVLRGSTRVEESPHAILLPYLEWRPSASWTIRTEYRDGLGLEATHGLDGTGAWALQARAVYSERRFRMDGRSIRPDGVFEDIRFALSAGLRWQPARGVNASLTLGWDLHQEFTLTDKRGHGGTEFESDPAPVLGFEFSLAL